MLVSEKKSVYLLITKKFASLIIKNLKIKFENFYFQIFTIPLIFEMTNSDRIFKSDSVSYLFLQQSILSLIKLFIRQDFSLNWTKFLSMRETSLRRSNLNTNFLDFIYYFGNHLNQKSFTRIRTIANLFFFNSFFFSLFLTLDQLKVYVSLKIRKTFFYFALNFSKSIFENKYTKIISFYNRFLTLQTGVLKVSKYFVNRNYLFATSTQLFRARKVFFFKYFFKNTNYRVFKKYKEKWKKLNKLKIVEGIYTWGRSVTILPFFINKIFYIYNGTRFTWIKILPGMVGYKLGQFSFTRKIHAWNTNVKSYFKNILQ